MLLKIALSIIYNTTKAVVFRPEHCFIDVDYHMKCRRTFRMNVKLQRLAVVKCARCSITFKDKMANTAPITLSSFCFFIVNQYCEML